MSFTIKPGLFFRYDDGIHTWGVESRFDEKLYDKLSDLFYKYCYVKGWFRQGDSNHGNYGDKSWLFIEFLNQEFESDLDALKQAEDIAKELGVELNV